MYEKYFGLDHRPFSITPDPRFLFLGARHREALAHLIYGVGEGGGFVQLTGEVGTGKTTLCRTLLERLPERVDVALILNPRLDAAELVAAVCDELHVSYPAGSRSIKTLVDALNAHLLEAHGAGRRTVLIIDEAQDLSPEVLEQVRLLTNLETAEDKLLQIILIGQPELRDMLARDDLRQLAQRITARDHLEPLAAEETAAYVEHRLRIAGAGRPLFTAGALRALHRLSGGIPRLVNVIADRALLGAYAGERGEVDAGIVRRAAHEVRAADAPVPGWVRPATAAALGIMAFALAGLAWLGWTTRDTGDAFPPAVASAPSGSTPAADAAPPAAPALDGIFAAAADGGEAAAWHALYALWGVSDAAVPGDCGQPLAGGLRCIAGSGNWTLLERMNRPALLTLRNEDGSAATALLLALAGDAAEVHVAGGIRRLPVSRIDPYWQGEYRVVWRPATGSRALREGMRGPDVERLRVLLAQAMRVPVQGSENPRSYDAGLKRQVIEFQKSRGLPQDGIVGMQTLFWLDVATSGPRTPRLATATGK